MAGKNGHGGARNGAGRKPGPVPPWKEEQHRIAQELIAKGLSPLAVLAFVMEWHFRAERYDEAAEVASKAAPYCHRKLASMEVQAQVEQETRQVVELIVTTRAEADQAIADLSAASGVSRQ